MTKELELKKIIRNEKFLRERISIALEKELQLQKNSGKKFITTEDVDSLIKQIIKEESNKTFTSCKAKPMKIEEQVVEHFTPNDESIGFLTANEFLYLRIQIRNEYESGWYLMFEGERIMIKPNGDIEKWPNNLYNTATDLLNELFGI